MKLSKIVSGILIHILPPTLLVLLFIHLGYELTVDGESKGAILVVGLLAWIILFYIMEILWGEQVTSYMREG